MGRPQRTSGRNLDEVRRTRRDERAASDSARPKMHPDLRVETPIEAPADGTELVVEEDAS